MKITNMIDKTLIKFVMVGIVNTLFGSAIMFAMYNLIGCSYWVSSAANYFFLNKHFTFENKSKDVSVVIKFIVNIIVCYLLAYGLARPAVRLLLSDSNMKVRENVAMLAGMILFVGFNYIGQRFFAFADPKGERDQ